MPTKKEVTPHDLYLEAKNTEDLNKVLEANVEASEEDKLDPYHFLHATLEAQRDKSELRAALEQLDKAIKQQPTITFSEEHEAVIKAARAKVAPGIAGKLVGAAAAVTAFVVPFMSSMLLMDNSNTTSNSTTGLDSIAPVASAVILAAGTAAVGVAYNNNLWARRTPEEPIRLSREGAQAVLSRLEDLPAPSHS